MSCLVTDYPSSLHIQCFSNCPLWGDRGRLNYSGQIRIDVISGKEGIGMNVTSKGNEEGNVVNTGVVIKWFRENKVNFHKIELVVVRMGACFGVSLSSSA